MSLRSYLFLRTPVTGLGPPLSSMASRPQLNLVMFPKTLFTELSGMGHILGSTEQGAVSSIQALSHEESLIELCGQSPSQRHMPWWLPLPSLRQAHELSRGPGATKPEGIYTPFGHGASGTAG